MQKKCVREKSSSETPCGCFGTTNKIFFTNYRRLQRLYPIEQILCGFHGVLAAKGHPHAAGQHIRQGSGLCFEQGSVHAAQRLAVGGEHLVRDAAEVPVIQLPGGGTRLAGRVQLVSSPRFVVCV